jgi:5-hydroxyisourate hydrolase-like protein (transthyretin family)
VSGAAGTSETNTVTATVSDDESNTITATGSATVDVIASICSIASGVISQDEPNNIIYSLLTNNESSNAQIEEISITWPAENGNLVEILLESVSIDNGIYSPSQATIIMVSAPGLRKITSGFQETLNFRFVNAAAASGYHIAIIFEVNSTNCEITFSN